MKVISTKLERHERDRLAQIGKQTIKPEQREQREPKGDPHLNIRNSDKPAVS